MYYKKNILFIILIMVILGSIIVFNISKPRSIETVTAFISSDSISIYSKNPGKIKRISVKQSDKIQKGQVIAEIESPAYAAKPAEKPMRLKTSEKEYENAAIMYKDGVISQTEYDKYLNNLKTRNEKSKNQIVKTSNLTKIYAPIDGTILLNEFKEGDTVTEKSILGKINSAQKEVSAYFSVSVKNEIKTGQPVDITVIKYPERKFSGTIAQVQSPGVKGIPVTITFNQNTFDLELKNGDSVIVKFNK